MFQNAHHALSWSYRTSSTPIIKISSINLLCGKPNASTTNELLADLTPIDRHTQAALIIGMVERMDDPACKEYIEAKFSGKKQSHSVKLIMHRALASLGTGIHRRRGVYKLLLCHLGESINQRSICNDLACSYKNMMSIRTSVFNSLDTVHNKAMTIMTAELQEKGLVIPT